MYKIAVLGDYASVYGFASLGLDTFPVDSPKEGEQTLRRLAENQYAVIYVTENLAAEIEREINRYKESMIPAIILIPGVSGNTGAGVKGVSFNVEKAVGSDILFGQESLGKVGDYNDEQRRD